MKEKQRILCIGDSLSLPREGISYEDTWFYMLSEELKQSFQFVHYFTRALLVKQIEQQYESYYKFYKADYIIWQSGITDCAPRIINEQLPIWKLIIATVNRLGLSSIFWKTIKLFFKRNPRCVNTSYAEFYETLERVAKKMILGGGEIVFIKIGKLGNSVQIKNKHWQNNINLYNRCFDEIKKKYPQNVIIIEPLSDATDEYYVDGYHTNSLGAKKVFQELFNIFQTKIT